MLVSRSFFLIFIIVFAGFLIRFHKLTTSPEGLYIDETSIAYNAFSIISTGRDEHGKFMPLFFEAFGEYKLPIYIYSVALVQLFVGPTDLSVRIPSLIFGTLSIFLIYLFTKELIRGSNLDCFGDLAPITAGFLLAVSPWHFQFSRPGFEAGIGLFLLLFGLYLFFRGVNTNSIKFIAFSLTSFVFTLYSYNSARIVTPMIVTILVILYFRKFSLRSWIKVGSVTLILAIPFLNFSLNSEGLVRAKQVSVFFQKDASASLVFENYLKNVSPIYLFKNGDPTFNHLTPFRMSLLHVVEAPIFFLGLVYLISRKSKRFLFVAALFFISLIPPAISTLNPHALRGMLALSATPIISAIGLSYLLNIFTRNYLSFITAVIFVFSTFASTLFFLNRYHNEYVSTSGWDWQVGIKRASTRVLEIEKNYSDIFWDVDPRNIPTLWYLKIDPALYQKIPNKNHPGKYHFGESVSSDHGLYIGLNPPQGTLLEYVYYPDNTVAYGIWEF